VCCFGWFGGYINRGELVGGFALLPEKFPSEFAVLLDWTCDRLVEVDDAPILSKGQTQSNHIRFSLLRRCLLFAEALR
jgi:hypothetical protein